MINEDLALANMKTLACRHASRPPLLPRDANIWCVDPDADGRKETGPDNPCNQYAGRLEDQRCGKDIEIGF